jgi:hypothetical protein
MVSPVRSATGSFDQGVIWFSRLFSDQVYPLPSTAAWKPKLRLATTLIQGAGVDLPGAECRHVLTAIPRKSPESIEELELRRRRRPAAALRWKAARRRRRAAGEGSLT